VSLKAGFSSAERKRRLKLEGKTRRIEAKRLLAIKPRRRLRSAEENLFKVGVDTFTSENL
jgi:hypothetical protein